MTPNWIKRGLELAVIIARDVKALRQALALRVRVDAPQALTPQQQAQGRANLGVDGGAGLPDGEGFIERHEDTVQATPLLRPKPVVIQLAHRYVVAAEPQ